MKTNCLSVRSRTVSVIGNGFVIAVIARFKTLRRSVPNILVANLAVVDLLNSAVNLPFHLISNSEASWYRGKTLALVVVFLSRLFVFLNLASMLAMLANAYLAIAYDFKYLAWKTKKKALICVFLIWFISIVTTILFSIPSFYINTIPDGHVNEYRAAILKTSKRAELNLPPLQAEARLQSDIKATKTIAITVAAYFLCYVPMIGNFSKILSDQATLKRSQTNSGNGEQRKVEDMLRKKRDERNDDEEQPEVHIDENQTRHKYSGQRRNARPCIHESVESKEYGEAQELSRGACAIQAQKPYDGKEENEEVLKGCGLANKSRKPFRTKVRPLEITELDNTGNLAEEKLENTCCPEKKPIKTQTSSRKRCNKITSGQEIQQIQKAACINDKLYQQGNTEEELHQDGKDEYEQQGAKESNRKPKQEQELMQEEKKKKLNQEQKKKKKQGQELNQEQKKKQGHAGAEAGADTSAGAEEEEAGTGAEAGAGAEEEAGAGTDTEADTSAGAGAGADASAEAEAEAETESDASAEAGGGACSRTEMQCTVSSTMALVMG
ncbi:hypothetical protein OS493_029555 [Desmophyllum pertusum]|uniref:G-protein coupled receptors family 1 profile domain-containing protein n=1 Tax=Desmophyllum pertusum TaxID=174260 RepID=A0A9W9ZXG9_9CNID|nr:hypothetical protein OS493_029555 [Desmophyllum pertusum]